MSPIRCVQWLLAGMLLAACASPCMAQEELPPATSMAENVSAMKSASFTVDRSYMARHDIVYLAPMQLEAEGFPMGNGDMGGMIWTHDNGVELQIQKNDVWSNPEEGGSRVPRHCARVSVDFGLPVFSWIHHLNDFEGRLVLRKGEAWFSAKTGFAQSTVGSWLAHDRNVWVIQCANSFKPAFLENGKTCARIALERVGSRAFGGWYAGGFPRDPAAGLGDTKSETKGGDLFLEERGDGMHFVVACRILGGNGQALRINNHRVEGFSDATNFTVLVSVATAEDAADPRAAALALLDGAQRDTVPALKQAKDDWFTRFWSRSFVKLGDDYLENIYYLRRYLMGAGSRGKYPVVFNGGLWRWNRDVVNWITPHHWNTQQQYWGLCAQNDCDLMRPYLDTYHRMAQAPGMAQLAARRGGGDDAILLAEMHNFDGTMVDPDRGDMRNNLTPAAQVASRFWEYYEYTGDQEFLGTKGYPFMKKAANFYLRKLQWQADKGRFSISGSVYEDGGGQGAVLNPLSDRNAIEALFTSCIQASSILGKDADMVPKWRHVLDHLWERRLVNEKDFEGEVMAACDSVTPPEKYSTGRWAVGGAIAFPAGLIGVDQKDSPLGKAVANYIRGVKTMYSHHPTPVIAARMGLGDEALRLLRDGIAEMQYFPQGLMFNCRGYPSDIYNLKQKVNLLGPDRAECAIRWRDFFQCGMETMSICGTAMNEMMMQSNEGKIRVFPAIPASWKDAPLAFKLLARGGFLVASERQKGDVVQVSVRSLRGGPCRLQNPWPGQAVRVNEHGTSELMHFRTEPGDVIAVDTLPDREYVVCRSDAQPLTAPATVYRSEPNKLPKKLGESRMLGIDKGLGR
jgi:alpha-L-fucosidase 2